MATVPLKDRLRHIHSAILEIEAHRPETQEALAADRFRQLGIERCLEIVSEASRHIPEEVRHRHPEIPWRQVADIGNRLRHAYHAVDSMIIWEVIAVELKDLKSAIEAMLAAADRDQTGSSGGA